MMDNIQHRISKAATLLKQGDPVSAAFTLKKVLRHEPDNVAALLVCAEIYLRSGKQFDSVDLINKLFELEPKTFEIEQQRQLGNLCFETELFRLASQVYEWVNASDSQDVLSRYRQGIALRRLGDMDSAEQNFLQCIELRPEVAATYLQLGHIFKARGDTPKAADYYKNSIARTTTEQGTGYWSLADLKSYSFSDAEIDSMRREAGLQQENLPQLSALFFALGKAAEQKQNYAEAKVNYVKGNSIEARLKPFHFDHFSHLVRGLKEIHADGKANGGSERPIPIFIVGLPRSGTTLIEQILSAHSRVQATDELPFLDRIALKLEMDGGYAKRLLAMSEQECRLLRSQYLDGLSGYLKGESDFFIDKYPGNFLHIGLIRRILPGSLVIDARRDPRDNAISAWRQLFNAGNEFSTSFDDICRYYQGYLSLMSHWRSICPGQINTVSYERLVTAPESEIKVLLDFCGLARETACFEFHKHKRVITTPSVGQVTQPMYTSSIGQWRHYEAYFPDEMLRLGQLANVT